MTVLALVLTGAFPAGYTLTAVAMAAMGADGGAVIFGCVAVLLWAAWWFAVWSRLRLARSRRGRGGLPSRAGWTREERAFLDGKGLMPERDEPWLRRDGRRRG